MLYLLFFCSGISGLIYQVIWVREFGNAFGNTVYSASVVVAVFMSGLGAGSYLVGRWADRRYATRPDSLLRAYGFVELAIAGLGLAIALILPHLSAISALTSSYSRDAAGWYVPSTASYLARGAIATLLVAPVTLLMGGTLTLLIRHLVRKNVQIAGARIAVLYGVNTAGAALGCFLTDFALVPAVGLQGAQVMAAVLNFGVAVAALSLARREVAAPDAGYVAPKSAKQAARDTIPGPPHAPHSSQGALILTCVALGLSGFGAMGMEILWFRHLTMLLGGLRAVFSLLLTVMLVGIGLGSLVERMVHRRVERPTLWLIGVQGLFVTATLYGLAAADVSDIVAASSVLEPALNASSALVRAAAELRLNLTPILFEVSVPSLLMGLTFPLANSVIQHAEPSVGRRAGVLYLSNTIGAVCGSLATGFLLLPMAGIQASATVLAVTATLALVPLFAAVARGSEGRPARRLALVTLTVSALMAGGAVARWLALPSDYLVVRTEMPQVKEARLLTMSEGVNEVLVIADVPGEGRQLLINGHPMSSTNPMSRRYMRALAHLPLLSIDHPAETVLVIGFGVGETLHAVTLHPSVRRVDLADLSGAVLTHAGYFRDTNKDVLNDPRVAVYVNDGRQHLRMQPAATYDLITLEPPPIANAGVGALYSKEFYTLARSRLKPNGYLSQWLPAYQVPPETTLAMVRAFIEVFPQAVLVSGAGVELLLVGTNAPRIEIDPARVVAGLAASPAVQADLQRLDLGSVRELVGTFMGAPQTLADATRNVEPVTDDRPTQEYGVHSLLMANRFGVPKPLLDLSQVGAWCPKCFVSGRPAPIADGLDVYLGLLDGVYKGVGPATEGSGSLARPETRRLIQDSAYLETILPDVHDWLGVTFAKEGRYPEAIKEFREGIRLAPDSAETHRNLGHALASTGAVEEAIVEFQQVVRLDPNDGQTLVNLGSALLDAKQYAAAIDALRQALRLMPVSSEVHNKIGLALLSSQGSVDEAILEFELALKLRPEFEDAKRNLARARQSQGRR